MENAFSSSIDLEQQNDLFSAWSCALDQVTPVRVSLPGNTAVVVSRDEGSPPPRRSPWRVGFAGSFGLGRKIRHDHVERRVIGDDHGSLSFVETGWRRFKMNVGYLPQRDVPQVGEARTSDDVLVHWSPSPVIAVDRLVSVSSKLSSPGARRTSELPAGSRLRQRARWVCGLNPDKQRNLVGCILRGRWTPDLTSELALDRGLSRFVEARGGAVKFLGGGTTVTKVGEGAEEVAHRLAYLWVCDKGKTFRVYPELLAKLAVYATLRKRSPALVLALRTRASEWCKKVGMDIEEAAHVLAPSVAIAYLPTTQEDIGASILETAPPAGLRGGWWTTVA